MKNGTAYFPQNLDRITNISVWGIFFWENWYQIIFWLAIGIGSNPINFINAQSVHFTSPVKMSIDKSEWITADNYGQQKMEFIHL